MRPSFLKKETCGLLVVDVQEKLFPSMDHGALMLEALLRSIKAARLLGLPIVVTEQYPKGLGPTIGALRSFLPGDQTYFSKTAFSALQDLAIKQEILSRPQEQWLIVGIEAHVCVMQTAKDLVLLGKEAIVLNDAITSQSIYDFSTAIGEMKEWARVTSSMAAFYEIVNDASHPQFKPFIELFKQAPEVKGGCCSCC